MPRYRFTRRDLVSWPIAPFILIAAGLVIAGVPEDVAGEDLEGPTLIPLGEEHAFQLSNAVAILLLLAGAAGAARGAARHTSQIVSSTHQHPFAMALLALQLTAGLVLLLISGASTTLAWWATGTFLSVTAMLGLSAVLKQGIP